MYNATHNEMEVFMRKQKNLYFAFIIAAVFFFLFACSLNQTGNSGNADTGVGNLTANRTVNRAVSDSLTSFNSGMWQKADWNNGSPFGCTWNPNNISFSSNGMTITLNNTARNGRSYSGGEYRTNDTFTYGTFTVNMSTFTQSGTVQSFFLYTGSPWDEIDVEKIGNKGWQYNYFINGQGGHEFIGNGSATITWAPNYITYGGRTINGSSSTLPSHPMQVMMNVWNHDGSTNDWLGTWNYSGARTTTYRNFSYTPLNGGSNPTPTRPPAQTPTRTSGGGGSGCSGTTGISVPFTRDGAGEFCWSTSNIGNYINSWNLDLLEINGVNLTNRWAGGGSLPAKQNGLYNIHYKGSYPWSHFEAR